MTMMSATTIAIGLVATLALPWLLGSPLRRLILFLGGTLVTAGSSAGVTLVEIAFLALILILGLVALNNVAVRGQQESPGVAQLLMSVRLGALTILATTLLALVWGALSHGSVLDAARGSISYLTIPVGILCGLDAARTTSPRTLAGVIFGAAIATSISFMLFYSSIRGVGSTLDAIPILPSMSLAGMGVALGGAKLSASTSRKVLPLVGVAVPTAALLVSGTRSGLLLPVGLLAGIIRDSNGRRPFFRITLWGLLSLVAVVPLVALAARLLGTGDFVRARIETLHIIGSGGIGSDASGASRVDRYELAWREFLERPILGHGFGAQYFDGRRYLHYLDTPVMYLASFGLVGTFLLLWALATVVRASWRAANVHPVNERLAARFLIGAVAVWLALSPLSAILEERGFALAVALAVAFSFSEVGSAALAAEIPHGVTSRGSNLKRGHRL